MRRATLLAFVAACTCPGKAATDRATTPAAALVQPPAAAAQAASTPAEPARPPVTSDPDVPTGAAAARDAELAKVAAAVVDAFSDGPGLFTRDGRRVVFNSNRDGLPQIYVADAGRLDAPATRVVHSRERAVLLETTKDGRSILFMSDHGADENWDFFQVDLDGGNPVQITSGGPLNRDPALLRDGQPDTIFFSARAMSEAASSLYAQPLRAGAPAKRLYGEDGFGVLEDVSPDARWGAWVRVPTDTDNTVVLVDLATGAARPLYPTAGPPVTIHDTLFSRDGKRLYVSTDGGADQSLLLAFDVKTGKEVARYVETRPATALLMQGRAARKGDHLAYLLHAGNHIQVRLLDGRTLKPRGAVSTPLGAGSMGDFSPDGTRLLVSWSTPESPADLHAIDVKTGAMTPLHREPRPSLAALGGVESKIEVIKAHDGLEIPINVHLPAGAAASGRKLPVIVEFHGGPAGAAVVRWDPQARVFLSQGYAYVRPNVRGSSGFGRAFQMADDGPRRVEAFKDVERVGRWVASQPWADERRLVVAGASYGGYTVLVALTRQASLWRAGVDFVGVVNMRSFLASTSGAIRELFKLEFGDLEKDGALLDAMSPIREIDKIVDPLFVYQGANDPRVPRGESDQVVRALRERGIPVEYVVAHDEGHSLARRENQITVYSRVARFLETALAK